MTWWILTDLANFPTSTTLTVKATTQISDHLFMAWSYFEPARHQIYKIVRGVILHCGWKYVWDTPSIADQLEPHDTLQHTWLLAGLTPRTTIWYYLFTPDGPYGLECQGPLVHVSLGWLMAKACRIARAALINVPHAIWTTIPLDTEMYDTDGIWNPASPNVLTIQTAGLYDIAAQATWNLNAQGSRMLQIYSPFLATTLVYDGTTSSAMANYYPSHTMATQYDLPVGATLSLVCWQGCGVPLAFLQVPGQRPCICLTLVEP